MEQNVAILGFGRSGTTWISDIVSKALGGLILFEPFHPSVSTISRRISYSSAHGQPLPMLKDFLAEVLSKRWKRNWLLRNHVPYPLDEVSPALVETIWRECEVIGFKEIRANFLIRWFVEEFNLKVVFLIRDPCATIASIARRRNFFLEFGWPESYKIFLNRTIYDKRFENHKIVSCYDLLPEVNSDIGRYAVMWAISHCIALSDLESLGLPVFHYEHFYSRPFAASRALLDYLGTDSSRLHPSYIFTPSMTTMRTLHGLYDFERAIDEEDYSFFWKNTLSDEDVHVVREIVNTFGINLYNEKGTPDLIAAEV